MPPSTTTPQKLHLEYDALRARPPRGGGGMRQVRARALEENGGCALRRTGVCFEENGGVL